MGTEGKTCEDRIANAMEGRLKQFIPQVEQWSADECTRYLGDEGRCVTATEIGDLRDEVLQMVQERATESLLAVDKRITYRLCISCGGPADFFELNWDPEAACWTSGSYIFQDWFDGASRPLSVDQVERLAEVFGLYPDLE